MRVARLGVVALVVVACCLGTTAPATAQQSVDSARTDHRSFWHAAAGILVINGVPWAHNWYVHRWPWANVGTRTWGENLRLGFGCDDDSFLMNQLAHPYHGSLYLNSARASGYGFWGSLPYVAAGSASWELLLENVRPSLNDIINTTLGGMALGEVTYRLSALLGSSRGPERNSFSRELGAFAFSPISQTQSLLSGKARDSYANAEWARKDVGWVAVGRQGEHGFVMLNYQYGSPFDVNATRPYDAFEFTLELGRQPTGVVNQVTISGLLARRDLIRSERTQLVLGLYQHYDYRDLPRLEASGQSLSGGLSFQRRIGRRTHLRLGSHLEGLLLGAMSSDHAHRIRRDYDYGPGAGARLSASLQQDGRDLLRFEGRLLWLHSVYGAEANHLATYIRIGTAVRFGRFAAVGGDIGVATRHSSYRNLPSTTIRVPQSRVFIMWPAR
jgi:hypothetical protein